MSVLVFLYKDEYVEWHNMVILEWLKYKIFKQGIGIAEKKAYKQEGIAGVVM